MRLNPRRGPFVSLFRMADFVKTLEVSLQEHGFCIATGPHDSGVVYPCPTNPFAPVLVNSPVVLHLYCPKLFPNEVLKLHAEHLGHFLSLQCVPEVNAETERALFLGLCKSFTRTEVLSLYKKFLTDDFNTGDVFGKKEPIVFSEVAKFKMTQVVSLLRSLLGLFDLKELRYGKISHERGQEPKHMLFLYLIQLLAIFVSSCMEDKDLATVMSIASAPFLEANHCDPICAATLLKPMFIPEYDEERASESGRGRGRGGADEQADPEEYLKYYRLFGGYELDSKGSDVSSRREMSWTENSILNRMQGCKIVEEKSKLLWFVAPQMGDRMLLTEKAGLKMMGGQTGEKALRICSYLVSDNVMAYIQCAIFGTISNMLPCHANSDFTETVMKTIEGSMSKFADAVRLQSASLMTGLSKMTNTCLHVAGVGFSAQDRGNQLHFGKVFTGPEEKRPAESSGRMGVFTSVFLGLSDKTMMKSMLNAALNPRSERSLGCELCLPYVPVGLGRSITDLYFYGRYHHTLNSGEFTEVACVKPMSDPRFNSTFHGEELTHESKYQLTVCHGALPMCTLTLAMTVRQAVTMVMGLMCAELARVAYLPKASDVTLCKHLVSLAMAGKFRHRKDAENTNAFEARYADTLKLSAAMFNAQRNTGSNICDLNYMEWLEDDDPDLPNYIRNSLRQIGSTRTQVEKIMCTKGLNYNRVLFLNESGPVKFKTVFANKEFMIHAPLMSLSCFRVFSNSTNSYGCIKMCKSGQFYPVRIYSNSCIEASLYQRSRDDVSHTAETNTTIDEMVERVKRSVSSLLPRIELSRLKMMSSGLNDTEFDMLVSAVKANNINVIGQIARRSASPDPSRSADRRTKRVRESPDCRGDDDSKRARMDSGLTVMDTDVDFGFDDSD